MNHFARVANLPFWTLIAVVSFGCLGCFGYAGFSAARSSAPAADRAPGPKLRSPVTFTRDAAGRI
jgi:hypothetical protein